MKRTILFLLIQVGLLTACQQTNKKDDSEKLKSVLTEYTDGIKNRDLDKMNAVTTSDFVLFEDGKVFNNDSLVNFLNSFSKFSINYKIDYLKINVDNNSGYMIYLNRGEMILNDTTKLTINWLESATFKKVADEWKLEFLHSTVRKQ